MLPLLLPLLLDLFSSPLISFLLLLELPLYLVVLFLLLLLLLLLLLTHFPVSSSLSVVRLSHRVGDQNNLGCTPYWIASLEPWPLACYHHLCSEGQPLAARRVHWQ